MVKRYSVYLFGSLLCSGCIACAAVNYYQGDGANNRLTTAESWSEGILSEDDIVYFSEDGWTVRNAVAATAASGAVGLTHVFFNSNILNDFQLLSNSAEDRLRVTGRIRVLDGVAGKVTLDGFWNFRDLDLNVDHYGTNTLVVCWEMVETAGTPGADLNYFGSSGVYNPILFQAGTIGDGRANYTGRTILQYVYATVFVAADETGGALGFGADIRLNNAELHLVDDATLSNDQITITGYQSVFDVSGRTGGSYSYDGVLRGFNGSVTGDLTLTGELLPGDETGGIGTLTFNDELIIGVGCGICLELNGYAEDAFDRIVGNESGELVSDSGSSWTFDFSGWSDASLTNGASFAVLSGWSELSVASANISVVGLPSGYSLDTSVLFTEGIVTVHGAGNPPLMDIAAAGNRVVLGLNGTPGSAYTIRETTDLAAGTWSNSLFGCWESNQVYLTNAPAASSVFYQTVEMPNVSWLGNMNGFYRNRRLLDAILDSQRYLLTIPDWLRDPSLDFHYKMKSNDLVAATGREIFLADNLNLVRVMGGWVTNSINPTIEDVKQYDLFYLDDFGEPAYRWNLLDDRIDPLIDRGYVCSNITLVLDNVPYDLADQVEIATYGQCGIPYDFDVWGEFVRQMCLRLQSNYGDDANGFRFRIGTESQSAERFRGSEEEFFKFYDYAETAIKSVLPGAGVGPFNRGQFGDPSGDIISMQRLAEHCATGTNFASGAVGSAFDWVAHSFYFLADILHPDDFIPLLSTLYDDIEAEDERYRKLPLEIHEFGPLVTEGRLIAWDTGVRGAAQIMETLVDLRKIGLDRTYEYRLEETLVQAESKVLVNSTGWLYCIFDRLRGGPSWSLPFNVVSGSETNSIETLAAVVDDTTYLLVSCWNVNRKVTEGSTVTVTIPSGVHSFSESVQIEQVLFCETNSVYDVIWQEYYYNDMLSSAQIRQYENYGKATSWAATGNGMAADAVIAKQYVIDNWDRYEALMVDSLDLKSFTGAVQYLGGGEAVLTLELPVPSVYVIKMSPLVP